MPRINNHCPKHIFWQGLTHKHLRRHHGCKSDSLFVFCQAFQKASILNLPRTYLGERSCPNQYVIAAQLRRQWPTYRTASPFQTRCQLVQSSDGTPRRGWQGTSRKSQQGAELTQRHLWLYKKPFSNRWGRQTKHDGVKVCHYCNFLHIGMVSTDTDSDE